MYSKSITLFLLVILSSCAGVQVTYDYDKKVDFTQYTTYGYYPDMNSGLSQLDEKRLFRNIDSIFKIKGLKKSSSPDMYINVKSSSRPKPKNSSVGIGIGGSGRNIGGGMSVGVPIGQEELYREIIIDIVNVEEDELIWQAVTTGTITEQMNPEVREAKLKELAEKVFSKYPPQTR